VRIADLPGPAGTLALDATDVLYIAIPGEGVVLSLDVAP
jgi:hypothetical protein